MIKINLLREPKKARSATIGTRLRSLPIIALGVGILVLAALGLWYWSLSSQLEEKKAERLSLQQEKASLAQVLQQIEQAKQTKVMLDQRLNLIEGLRTAQSSPVRLMNGLLQAIPGTPKLWLTSFTQQGSRVVIEGRTFDVPTIADFISSLKRQPLIGEVDLEFWEEQQNSFKFKLNCLTKD